MARALQGSANPFRLGTSVLESTAPWRSPHEDGTSDACSTRQLTQTSMNNGSLAHTIFERRV